MVGGVINEWSIIHRWQDHQGAFISIFNSVDSVTHQHKPLTC